MADGQGPSSTADRARRRLLVAVLLEGEVAAEVTGLRRAITGHEGHLAPHVTLVPPVNVAEGALGEAFAVVRQAAAGSAPLALELGPPGVFERPGAAVLHLAVADEGGGLHALAAAAARAPLAPPPKRAPRRFTPHVTLGRLEPGRAGLLAEGLAAYRARVSVTAVQLLVERAGEEGRRWEVQADELLGGRTLRQRGGLELELRRVGRLDPEAASALAPAVAVEWGRESLVHGAGFALVARRAGAVVGAAAGRRQGPVAWCTCLFVLPAARRLGTGGRLVDAVERGGAGEGIEVVRYLAPAGGELASLLGRRGYGAAGWLAGPAGGAGLAVLERRLPRLG